MDYTIREGDFEYVVNQEVPGKVCFGSGLERRSVFDERKFQTLAGPQTYILTYPEKIRSKRGIPGLVNQEVRIPPHRSSISPGPGKYYPGYDYQKPLKPNFAPFNSTSAGLKYQKINNYPGPTDYNPHKVKLCKRIRFDYNFGNPCLAPYVEMVCINYPKDICAKCEQPFEIGDHWHYKHSIYLCNFCMIEEHKLHEMFDKDKLLQFKKIRTCSFMHRHEGTSAKVRLMTKKDIKKKINMENYLSLYTQCFGTKSRTELVVPLNAEL